MTGVEHVAINTLSQQVASLSSQVAAINQRLYGGPADDEVGDIIATRDALADMSKRFERRDAQINLLIGLTSLIGLGGLAAIVRVLGS